MNKYFVEHLKTTFQSLRKEVRESAKISFHKAYILVVILIGVLGMLYVWTLNTNANSGYQMTRIESVRREKQEEKHFLRAQIARQESQTELGKHDDHTIVAYPDNMSYIFASQ